MNAYLNNIVAILPSRLVPEEITEESVLKAISMLVTENDNALYALLK